MTVHKQSTAQNDWLKIEAKDTSSAAILRTVSTVVLLLFPRWRLDHFEDVVLMVAENAPEVRLRLVCQSLTDRLLLPIGCVFYVPNLGHSTTTAIQARDTVTM